MTRSVRLLDLMELLRRYRRPVRGTALAEELGVSLRTLYRDIATLQGQGVSIEGEAGFGYLLRPGFTLPPLMFDEGELDALVLGLRFVVNRLPDSLGYEAQGALAKIEAVLPPGRSAADVQLLIGSPKADDPECLGAIRTAIRAEETLRIAYQDKNGRQTECTIWPVVVGFFEAAEVVAAWCELRSDFRNFRLDRIEAATATGRRMGRRHRLLLAEWRLGQELGDL